jgi:hypothetical protein
LLSLAEQGLHGQVCADNGRLQHDVAEILRDADVALQQSFDHGLVVHDAVGDEAEQVVVAAADQVAFHQFVHAGDRTFEAQKRGQSARIMTLTPSYADLAYQNEIRLRAKIRALSDFLTRRIRGNDSNGIS